MDDLVRDVTFFLGHRLLEHLVFCCSLWRLCRCSRGGSPSVRLDALALMTGRTSAAILEVDHLVCVLVLEGIGLRDRRLGVHDAFAFFVEVHRGLTIGLTNARRHTLLEGLRERDVLRESDEDMTVGSNELRFPTSSWKILCETELLEVSLSDIGGEADLTGGDGLVFIEDALESLVVVGERGTEQ